MAQSLRKIYPQQEKGGNVPQGRTISKITLQKDDQEVMPSPTVSFREEENPKNPNFLAFVVIKLDLKTHEFLCNTKCLSLTNVG